MFFFKSDKKALEKSIKKSLPKGVFYKFDKGFYRKVETGSGYCDYPKKVKIKSLEDEIIRLSNEEGVPTYIDILSKFHNMLSDRLESLDLSIDYGSLKNVKITKVVLRENDPVDTYYGNKRLNDFSSVYKLCKKILKIDKIKFKYTNDIGEIKKSSLSSKLELRDFLESNDRIQSVIVDLQEEFKSELKLVFDTLGYWKTTK